MNYFSVFLYIFTQGGGDYNVGMYLTIVGFIGIIYSTFIVRISAETYASACIMTEEVRDDTNAQNVQPVLNQ